MNNHKQTLTVGKKVWWSDPNHDLSSGEYEVVEIRYDEDDALYDDTIILISDGTSVVEVNAWELQSLEIRQEYIKEFADKITIMPV